jgi:hypothetical protein
MHKFLENQEVGWLRRARARMLREDPLRRMLKEIAVPNSEAHRLAQCRWRSNATGEQ